MQNDHEISHEAFYSMIRPALGSIAVTDAMATFSEKFVYFRLPSQQPGEVEWLPWEKLDILLDSSKPILNNYLEGGPCPEH